MPLFEVKDLSKVYNEGTTAEVRALDGISFKIEEGEFLSIMGPSGSGKSTLLHMLGFLDRQTRGVCDFRGRGIGDYSDDGLAQVRNKEMGFVFQAFNLLSRTTVLDNIMLPLFYSDLPKAEWHGRAERAASIVGLGHRLGHEPAELSGGEKQRVAIARALVNDPGVIFADEPTGNLDSKSGGAIMESLSKLNEEGKTVVLITHETYTASYAKRILHLQDGKLEEDEAVAKRSLKGLSK